MSERPRRRLSFWRFVLALLLGISTWLGVSWFSEPRPLWRIKPQGNRTVFPCGTNEDESLTLAYEFAMNPGPGQELGLGGLCILDSRTGQRLHQIEADAKVFDGDSYFALLHAQPRIIGTVAWRVARRQVNQELWYELRAWDFSRNDGEKVIHVWKNETGQYFRIAFADNKSPYLITQTSYPWQPLLVGIGMEGWSQLTCALSFTHYNNEKFTVISSNPKVIVKQGLVLPFTQTWKIPEQLKEPFKPLACWMLPPLRQTWPPAMGPELSWVAFGNNQIDHEWKASNSPSIFPDSVLVYDGRTGEHFKLATEIPFEQSRVSAAGNLLLIRQDPNVTSEEQRPFLTDIKTGARLHWPDQVTNLEAITEIHAIRNSDGLLLVFSDQVSATDGAVMMGMPGNPTGSIMLMQRHENTLSLMAQIPLRTENQHAMSPTTHAGAELVVQALADSAPPFLRELSTKWEWLKPFVYKYWPDQQPHIKVYDLVSGRVIKTISNAYPSQLYQFHQSSLLYVMKVKPGDMNQSELEAWRLPVAAQCWSPWWGRSSGILVFLLFLGLLHRRVSTPKAAL